MMEILASRPQVFRTKILYQNKWIEADRPPKISLSLASYPFSPAGPGVP